MGLFPHDPCDRTAPHNPNFDAERRKCIVCGKPTDSLFCSWECEDDSIETAGMEEDEIKMRIHYHWLHIPTGKTGVYSQRFIDRKDFLEKMAGWNRIGAGTWQYWEKT